MLDEEQVTAETLSATFTDTAPGEIAVYDKAFRTLSRMAVCGPTARRLIAEAEAALG
ncbi:hypothetical protein KCMC57_up05150 [Kitasatospora sp. CMC57]|uniref:DUF5753 domain-containing protein n=1 Tax=Kitasatospora sp. CMC57 TaxID=3231513 RepID=A0AB33JRW6_9ACTN